MLFYSYVLDYEIMVFREYLKLRYFDREKRILDVFLTLLAAFRETRRA